MNYKSDCGPARRDSSPASDIDTPTWTDERGSVLIIVLAMVVLLAALVVAYLSRTMMDRQSSNTSFNQSKADELARSALDIVTADLKQEVVNGSSVVPIAAPTTGTASFSPIYAPTNNAYMIPTQNWPGQPVGGAASTIPNLVRVSSTTAIAFPGVDHLASAVPSTTPSANGRFVSLARWNQHYLIPRLNVSSTSIDSTPIASFTAAVPNWVYITTSGPAVITSPSNTVIGRYAYAVYDEGGLLDMNTAGYPSPSTPAQIGGKAASLGYADLTQLVSSSGSQLLTSSQIDQIVGWRNYASIQPSSGTLGSFVMSSGNATSYFNFITSATNSFLTVNNAIWNGKTDQAFLSRQELIGLQSSIGFSQDALQYLGTFSREINAPTFYYPAPGSPTYTNTATNSTTTNDPVANTTNVNILSLRMAKSGTRKDDNGATFSWNAGDPLVCRRFSLARLSDIAYNATNTSTTSDIYYYFGLCRSTASSPDASQSVWTYTGSSGSTTAAASIETLAQVAAETPSREPNFFELLKAALHQDSIGVGNGTDAGWVGNSELADNLSDLQIIRVGANIIDQATTDNYPTVIAYNPTSGTPLYAYGIKDLPYINAVAFRFVPESYYNNNFKDAGAPNRVEDNEIIPVLWRPHRSINDSTSLTPGKIQLYMTGMTYYALNGGYQYKNASGTTVFQTTSTNETTIYGASGTGGSTYLPYNEIGLSNFSVSSTEQNTGSIILDQTQFSSFTNPNLILASPGGGVTAPMASGAYGTFPVPYNSGVQGASGSYAIMGLTLQNHVYAQGREANPATDFPSGTTGTVSWADTAFDGYCSGLTNTPQEPWYSLYLGAEGEGFNIVLRYLDYGGNYQVYNALASNEADPNGKVNTNYDVYGICATTGTTSSNGVGLSCPGPQTIPCYVQTAATIANWAKSGGTLTAGGPVGSNAPNGHLYDQVGVLNNKNPNSWFTMKADPRTARFGVDASINCWNICDFIRNPLLTTTAWSSSDPNYPNWYSPVNANGYGYYLSSYTPASTAGYVTTAPGIYPGMWAQNSMANGLGTYVYDWDPLHGSTPSKDRTGVVRPGDDYFTGASGLPYTGWAGTSTAPANGSPPNVNNIYEQLDARPIVLNRPFRSVGELGYVFRDVPFKSLDMSSSVSVDAALLDFFTVDAAQVPLVAGKVNLNTRQPMVLQCILNGSFRLGDPTTSGGAGIVTMGPNAAKTIAGNILAITSAVAGTTTGPSSTGPLSNKAELVTRLGTAPNMPNTTSTIFDSNPNGNPSTGGTYPIVATDTPASSPVGSYPSIKTQREAPVRALADVANTRTWNLLIDVIAQTGQYAPGQTDISQFIVTGERRCWLHVAIDRFTGKVVDQQLEPVFE